jgi:hypothetical protein
MQLDADQKRKVLELAKSQSIVTKSLSQKPRSSYTNEHIAYPSS